MKQISPDIVHAFILSRLDYYNSIFALSKYDLPDHNKLQHYKCSRSVDYRE